MNNIQNYHFKKTSHRFKCLEISPDLLFEAFLFRDIVKEGIVRAVEVEGIPDDAEVKSIYFDYSRSIIRVLVWSSSFEELPIAQEIPLLTVKFHERRFFIRDEYSERDETFHCPLPVIVEEKNE